jgi:hypothetical protein
MGQSFNTPNAMNVFSATLPAQLSPSRNVIMFPSELLNLEHVDSINLLGRGGKETSILPLLPNWKRANSPLYDYEINYQQKLWKVEVKKQENLQWFDSGKYFRLNQSDRDIFLILINHIRGRIILITAIQLGDFIDLLLSTPENQHNGWKNEVLETAAYFKTEYPSLQFKAKVRVANLIRDYQQNFQVLFRRQE